MPKDLEAMIRAFVKNYQPNDLPEFVEEFVKDLYELLQAALTSDGEAVFARRDAHGQGGAGFEEAVALARDQAIRAVGLHEAGGPVCWDERVNVIAYLAHALRLGPVQLPKVLTRMREFEHGHEERHRKEGGERGGSHP